PGRPRPADGRFLGARAWHHADGNRPQELGAQSVPAVPRREEPVRGGRRGLRFCRLPESDLDDHGTRLAQLRLPRGRAQKGRPVTDDETIPRRQALAVAAGAAAAALPQAASAQAAKPPALPPGRFLTARELAILDEVAELIIPADAHSGGA